MQTIAHLSDTHLDTSLEREQRYKAVLRLVAELPHVDAIIISGDLADTGADKEYTQFFDAFPTTTPVLAVAGNHDLSAPLSDAQVDAGRGESLNATLLVDDLTIVGLDSHIDHRTEGILSSDTLAFARHQLDSAPGPTIITMHHPPVPVGHHIMDKYGLRQPEKLEELVRDHDNVIAIVTGHVHTALATTFAGVGLFGAPGIASTMRLGSKTNPIADDTAMPGFALYTVDGRNIRAVFHYLSPSDL